VPTQLSSRAKELMRELDKELTDANASRKRTAAK